MSDQVGRGTAPDFLGNLTQAMRDSPISTALIGMGALWLIAGGARTSLLGIGGKSIFGSRQIGDLETLNAANRMREPVSTGVAAEAENAASRVGDLARGATSALVDVGSSVQRKTSAAASQVVDSLNSTYDAVARGPAAISTGLAASSQAIQSAKYPLSRLQHSIGESFDHQPLLLGAVGLAIGAGIAAALPVTEVENQLMGDASETVRSHAQEILDEKSRQGGAAVRDAVDAVPKAAGQAMRGVTDKLARVADAGRKELAQQMTGKKAKSPPF
jgi:hypothetical protein